mmetsp:Transcript_1682/g.5489  ORF Transcript_1682/g.5489 Transcript_1682/m.5489 type:complete len:216 (+) Transcript_1682:853-1500(+)
MASQEAPSVQAGRTPALPGEERLGQEREPVAPGRRRPRREAAPRAWCSHTHPVPSVRRRHQEPGAVAPRAQESARRRRQAAQRTCTAPAPARCSRSRCSRRYSYRTPPLPARRRRMHSQSAHSHCCRWCTWLRPRRCTAHLQCRSSRSLSRSLPAAAARSPAAAAAADSRHHARRSRQSRARTPHRTGRAVATAEGWDLHRGCGASAWRPDPPSL